MSKKIKIEDLIKKEYYENMIVLLASFQKKADGLAQKHFRYVLMNNENEPIYYEKKVKDFFEKYEDSKEKGLLFLYDIGFLRRGSIATQRNLNYYIKYLLKNNIIYKVNRKKHFRYKLTPEFFEEYNKMEIRQQIDRWDRYDEDCHFEMKHFNEHYLTSDDKKHVVSELRKKEDWTMFGLPKELKKMFTEDEIQEIKTYLRNVEENLWKIVELKFKKTETVREERKKQRKLPDSFLGRIDFYYGGEKRNK